MEILNLGTKDMKIKRTRDNYTPESFQYGGKEELMKAVAQTSIWKDELDEVIDNDNIEVNSFNIVHNEMVEIIAMIVKSDDIVRTMEKSSLSNFEVLNDNIAKVWLK